MYTSDKVMGIGAGRKLRRLTAYSSLLRLSDIPPTLVDQLSSGGRLIAPIGRGEDQQLVVLDKSIDGSVDRRTYSQYCLCRWYIP